MFCEDTQIKDAHFELGELLDNEKFRVESDSMGQVNLVFLR